MALHLKKCFFIAGGLIKAVNQKVLAYDYYFKRKQFESHRVEIIELLRTFLFPLSVPITT